MNYTSYVNLNNRMGFNQGNIACTMVNAKSPIKETMAGMTQEHDLVLITHQEDSILDSNVHSANETPTNEDTATETNPTYQPPSSAQFRIPVEINKEGVVVLDGSRVPYMKRSLSVMHVFFQETTSVSFLPLLRIIFKISLID